MTKAQTIPRELIDAACLRAIDQARDALLGGPFDPQDRPAHLIVVKAEVPAGDDDEIPAGPAADADGGTVARFISETTARIGQLIVGSYEPLKVDELMLGHEISMRQRAALDARTVIDSHPNAADRLDLARLIIERYFAPGDTGTFGAIPVQWSNPCAWDENGSQQIVPLVIAVGGWHPVANRHAAQQFIPQFELVLAEEKLWRPRVVASFGSPVLSHVDGLPTRAAYVTPLVTDRY